MIGSLRYLNRYIFKYKYRFFAGGFFVIISNFLAVIPPRYIKSAIDRVAFHLKESSEGEADYQLFLEVLVDFGVILLLVEVLRSFFIFMMRQMIIVMSRKIEYDLKNDLYAHYQKLPTSFYQKNSTGDLMNRMSEDISQVRMYLGPALMYTISLTSMIIICLINMIYIDPLLSLYVFSPFPVLSYLVYLLNSKIGGRSKRLQESTSRLSSFVQECISGIRILKAYAVEAVAHQKFLHAAHDNQKKSLSLFKTQAFFFPVIALLIGISNLIVIYVGGLHAVEGKITYGAIAQFVLYINMLAWPITSIGWVTSIVQRAAVSMRRVLDFLHYKSEIKNGTIGVEKLHGKIDFKNVYFTYPGTQQQVLKGLNFAISSGQTVAIMGDVGAGKSTIAKLIHRAYEVDQGEIYIDDIPVNAYDLGDLRKNISYVPQDAFLFSETIFDNIAFGVDRCDMKAVFWAADQSQVLEDIKSFEKSFDTMLGERGLTLSGGQKQRIAIARALILNNNIVIMDDSLSAVDTETEKKILFNLKKVFKGVTTLLFTHRVSSAAISDKILLIDKGRILAQGTHDYLIEEVPYYRSLCERQVLF